MHPPHADTAVAIPSPAMEVQHIRYSNGNYSQKRSRSIEPSAYERHNIVSERGEAAGGEASSPHHASKRSRTSAPPVHDPSNTTRPYYGQNLDGREQRDVDTDDARSEMHRDGRAADVRYSQRYYDDRRGQSHFDDRREDDRRGDDRRGDDRRGDDRRKDDRQKADQHHHESRSRDEHREMNDRNSPQRQNSRYARTEDPDHRGSRDGGHPPQLRLQKERSIKGVREELTLKLYQKACRIPALYQHLVSVTKLLEETTKNTGVYYHRCCFAHDITKNACTKGVKCPFYHKDIKATNLKRFAQADPLNTYFPAHSSQNDRPTNAADDNHLHAASTDSAASDVAATHNTSVVAAHPAQAGTTDFSMEEGQLQITE